MKQALFRFARSDSGGYLIRKLVTYMNWAIPVNRLYETQALMAFYHPVPLYPVHILLLPKADYQSLLDVPVDSPFQQDLFIAVQHLIREYQLEDNYRLICNGGNNQDVPILHFHLISE